MQNHFQLFGVPVSFSYDETLLRQKREQLLANGESAALLEKAYNTLSDPDATLEHLLKTKGLLPKDEVYEPDPQFTLETMEINDELTELEFDERQEQLMNVEQKTNRLLLKIIDDVAPLMEHYEESTVTEEEVLQLKEFYQQKKYLEGILDRIRGVRNIASP